MALSDEEKAAKLAAAEAKGHGGGEAVHEGHASGAHGSLLSFASREDRKSRGGVLFLGAWLVVPMHSDYVSGKRTPLCFRRRGQEVVRPENLRDTCSAAPRTRSSPAAPARASDKNNRRLVYHLNGRRVFWTIGFYAMRLLRPLRRVKT